MTLLHARSTLNVLILAVLVSLMATKASVLCADGAVAFPSTGAAVAQAAHVRYRIAVDQGRWNEIEVNGGRLPVCVCNGIHAQFVDKLQNSRCLVVINPAGGVSAPTSQVARASVGNNTALPASTVVLGARSRAIPATYVVTPSVASFMTRTTRKNGFHIGPFSTGETKTTATVTLNMRISNAATGELIDLQTALGTASDKSADVGAICPAANFTEDQFDAGPWGQAVQMALDNAVSQIAARLCKEPWECLVVAQNKTTGQVTVDAGSLAGVTVGQTFDIVRTGAGVVFRRGSQKIGEIKIISVNENAALGDVTSGSTFHPQDIARLPN
jgi:curli biogenesis system outer membrane secretion channel CsgG